MTDKERDDIIEEAKHLAQAILDVAMHLEGAAEELESAAGECDAVREDANNTDDSDNPEKALNQVASWTNMSSGFLDTLDNSVGSLTDNIAEAQDWFEVRTDRLECAAEGEEEG